MLDHNLQKDRLNKKVSENLRLCEELDLNFADALILAHALADPYSTHLITGDVRLRSDGVEKFEEDMRNSGERERKLLVDDRFSHG